MQLSSSVTAGLSLLINFPCSMMFVMISSYYHKQVAAFTRHFSSMMDIWMIKSPSERGSLFCLGYFTISSLHAMLPAQRQKFNPKTWIYLRAEAAVKQEQSKTVKCPLITQSTKPELSACALQSFIFHSSVTAILCWLDQVGQTRRIQTESNSTQLI